LVSSVATTNTCRGEGEEVSGRLFISPSFRRWPERLIRGRRQRLRRPPYRKKFRPTNSPGKYPDLPGPNSLLAGGPSGYNPASIFRNIGLPSGRPQESGLNPVEACPGSTIRLAPHTQPQAPPRQREALRADLRSILGEGAAHSVMVGTGESYLPAFVLAMGMGQVAAGLIATIPLLAGAILQLISPAAVRFLGSHRRWVVVCAAIQAASFLPLAIGALAGRLPMVLVFGLAAVYWAAGLGTSPAWSTWVATLVPRPLRASYFSRRTRVNQIATLTGFVIGGFSLQWGASADRLLGVFALLFLLAAACRVVSTILLAGQSEPQPLPDGHRQVSLGEFFRRFRHAGDGRLLVYLLSVQAAAQIAGPYFTPYMLRSLDFSYVSYVALISLSFVGKAVALPALGRLAVRFGTRKLLWLGGVGIVPISGLWLISNSFAFLMLVQVLAGIAWAAYELAMFLLFIEAIRPEERTSMLTNFNFANSLATVGGSLLGGALLLGFGKQPATYLTIFAVSSAARALTLVVLWRVPGAAREELLPAAAANVTLRPVPSRAA
jgi:MFS family permease